MVPLTASSCEHLFKGSVHPIPALAGMGTSPQQHNICPQGRRERRENILHRPHFRGLVSVFGNFLFRILFCFLVCVSGLLFCGCLGYSDNVLRCTCNRARDPPFHILKNKGRVGGKKVRRSACAHAPFRISALTLPH